MALFRNIVLCLGLFAAASGATGAKAQTVDLYELRGGLLWHSIDDPNTSSGFNLSRLEDLSFEALFYSPEVDAFTWLGDLRLNVGGNFNLAGRESHLHLGLTWQIPLGDTPFWVEGTFGGAVHNGALTSATYPDRPLGSRFLFYESIGVGAVFNDEWTVLATIEHASNAGLARPNVGLSNMGVKFGRRF